jgi:hypothetical protein
MAFKYNRKPRRIVPDVLTIAYIAIGAARELDKRGGMKQDVADSFGGELGFIGDITEGALELDRMGDDAVAAGYECNTVWTYEVAEEYGRRVAAALIDGHGKRGSWAAGSPLRSDIARQLVLAAFA